MKKRFIVLVLLALVIGAHAEGYDSFTKQGLAYSVISKKYHLAGVSVLDQQDNAILKRADIPGKIWYKGRRYKVLVICDGAFGGCWQLSHVSLPECVTTLGKGCFAWCINLEEITLPASVCVIGSDAFSSCPKLRSIYVPEGHVERVQQLLPKELRYMVKVK